MTLWWNNNCAWVDGAHHDSSQLERVSVSQGLFFQHPIYPWEWSHSRRKGKQEGRQTIFFTPLDPFVENPDEEENGMVATMSFEELGLKPWLCKQCRVVGINSPTLVQQNCIPSILKGNYSRQGSCVGGCGCGWVGEGSVMCVFVCVCVCVC